MWNLLRFILIFCWLFGHVYVDSRTGNLKLVLTEIQNILSPRKVVNDLVGQNLLHKNDRGSKTKHDWSYTGRWGRLGAKSPCWRLPLCRSGPEFWTQRYPACGGWRQSPINIDTSLVRFREDIPKLHLHHYHHVTRQGGFPQIVYSFCQKYSFTVSTWEIKGKITTPATPSSNTRLVNNGRTLEMEFLTPVGATMSGGPLAATFSLVGAHFHWGVSSCLGSEHTLNGVRSVVFCDVEKWICSGLEWIHSDPEENRSEICTHIRFWEHKNCTMQKKLSVFRRVSWFQFILNFIFLLS